ncbi:FliH/SctL family protein [Anaerobiospirillum sp. NML120449]|uniref:FliH/SctL family protein n=1 Tax=Anaerobiospirillum sp. NML120449 TaxID=2932817 RepID=UPI001FF37CCB|nr:FliH/SctL family protein [Anaerobiospirillum sp. NML120449]MCK0527473.1 hypothetical protein [Anaerobiospirillum sp. NML120449]
MSIPSHDHAFSSMNAKIDPNRVVASIKDEVRSPEYKEVTVVQGDAADVFTPMQWPLFDDGKPVTTNAMGYEVGGYFRRHQEALRMAKAEADRQAEEERLAAERAAIAHAQEEVKEESPSVSVEELEAIRNAARSEGYTEGLSQGHEEGYQKGVEQGKVDGFTQGEQEGKDAGYQDGFKVGREEGYAQGQAAGIAAGSDIVTTQADRFRHLADMLANPIREMDEKVTDEVVYIISRLAKVVLKRELKGDVEFLKSGIERCYSLLPEAKQGAEILLNENDYALMVAAIGNDYMRSQGWDLKPSEEIEEGDIVVNTRSSSVQWRVNDRIDALISDFLSGSADAVSSARKEVIDGAPDYDEVPKKPIIPPRDLMNMSDRIAQNMAQMAPRPQFANEAERTLAAAMGQDVGDDMADPDAAEMKDAAMLDESNAAIQAQAQARAEAAAQAMAPMSTPSHSYDGNILSPEEQDAIHEAAMEQMPGEDDMMDEQVQIDTIPPGQMQG